MPAIKHAFFAMLVLSACAPAGGLTPQPGLPADDPRQSELFAAECAVYVAAAQKLEADGRTVSRNITRGCPDDTATGFIDLNPMVSVPSVTPGYPQQFYTSMTRRGIPGDLADDIAQSKAFWDLVAKRDSLLAGF